MCIKKKKKELKDFEYTKVDPNIFNKTVDFDIEEMYDRVVAEMTAQQTKRDQLLMIYFAALAFIFPSLVSAGDISWSISGWAFILLGVVGFLFSLITIRYRLYKEVYWHSCRTLSVMMSVDKCHWKKENIQGILYQCICKKFKKYIKEDRKVNVIKFVWDNSFSGETLYVIILAIISNAVLASGLSLVLPFVLWLKILIGVLFGLAVFITTMIIYFHSLLSVYKVCVFQKEEFFNTSFGNAWFFHFYV